MCTLFVLPVAVLIIAIEPDLKLNQGLSGYTFIECHCQAVPQDLYLQVQDNVHSSLMYTCTQ